MYQVCSRILDRENELLNGIEAAQQQVRDTVVKREWAGFEGFLAAIDRIGAELEKQEGERKALFGALFPSSREADGETGFYRLIAGLPPEEQRELGGKYRELKMAGLRVRMNNDNLLVYIAGIKVAVSAFVESAFPGRGGRVYSPSGIRHQDMRCMVLNHRL
ncbi:MAG: hypothetical protein LBI94_07370 [Treponema sp.]|jgi:hypothetical protein|nr:hypothetical protein [Treponema sp.]